ncbi:MAG: hypothetical protein PF589_02945 [Gammaproteobacteria bacterium]|jgi:hypothetical protein|nr:hypothetical protein [Gammaproteobacteria bacterium]
MPLCHDIIKNREIHFTHSLTEADQAEKAVRLLADIVGIEQATRTRTGVLHVRYDVRNITLHMLETALEDVGFSLHHTLVNRCQREIIAYCEGALRSSLGIETDRLHPPSLSLAKPVPDNHNLDPRPDNWRKYI